MLLESQIFINSSLGDTYFNCNPPTVRYPACIHAAKSLVSWSPPFTGFSQSCNGGIILLNIWSYLGIYIKCTSAVSVPTMTSVTEISQCEHTYGIITLSRLWSHRRFSPSFIPTDLISLACCDIPFADVSIPSSMCGSTHNGATLCSVNGTGLYRGGVS